MSEVDEETLRRLAAEALMEEAKAGAKRAAVLGPSGWVKKKETINKRFLHSTLRSAVISNRYRSSNRKNKDVHHQERPSRKSSSEK